MDARQWEHFAAYVGDSGTGKSCLMHHFCHGSCQENTRQTIGVEFASRVIDAGGKSVKVQLWDTAGQERFRSVTRSYYRGSAVAIIVYDITRRATFDAAGQWITDARSFASPDVRCVLVGNKLDREDEREVDYLEASRWASEHELLFIETSGVSGVNVDIPFTLAAQAVLLAIENGTLCPEQPDSGISYGDGMLYRHSGVSFSGLIDPDQSRGSGIHRRGYPRRCCA